jgi:uncharacterized protein (TIGR02444 family)
MSGNPSRPVDGALWRFAVDLYGRTADACLALQDGYGLDVNLLLFAAWVAEERGLAMTADRAAEADGWVQDWREEVVRPLRAVRRRLKTGAPIPGPAAEALREAIMAAEIDAERIELDWLQRQAAAWPSGQGGSVEGALRAVFVQAAGHAPEGAAAASLAAVADAVPGGKLKGA